MNVLWQSASDAIASVVLAHGAGAGMAHHNMQSIADAFEQQGLATLRFNFPFIDAGRQRADAPAVATAAIAEAFELSRQKTSLPVWLGGHSFGGRMASHAVLDRSLHPTGLIFCSFPLHPPQKPSIARAAHLSSLALPLLFLSGTRDELADRGLLDAEVAKLENAELHWLDTADHGYRVLKRTRPGSEDVFAEMARVARAFVERHST